MELSVGVYMDIIKWNGRRREGYWILSTASRLIQNDDWQAADADMSALDSSSVIELIGKS